MTKIMVLSLCLFTLALAFFNLGWNSFTPNVLVGVGELFFSITFALYAIFSKRLNW